MSELDQALVSLLNEEERGKYFALKAALHEYYLFTWSLSGMVICTAILANNDFNSWTRWAVVAVVVALAVFAYLKHGRATISLAALAAWLRPYLQAEESDLWQYVQSRRKYRYDKNLGVDHMENPRTFRSLLGNSFLDSIQSCRALALWHAALIGFSACLFFADWMWWPCWLVPIYCWQSVRESDEAAAYVLMATIVFHHSTQSTSVGSEIAKTKAAFGVP